MPSIILSPNNIADYPWIWDFLEEGSEEGQVEWNSKQVYNYQGVDFRFAYPVFARERKNNRGYAYEMFSSDKLGQGAYGSVYRISCTLSNGKTGVFQCTDKKRVIKSQNTEQASREYQIAKHVPHLHVKAPQNGRMVMREMEGVTLAQFLKKHRLSRKDRLELTRSFLYAYKTQILAQLIRHRDLHRGNVLIKFHPERSTNRFEVNIIDYSLATRVNADLLRENAAMYVHSDVQYIVGDLWLEQQGIPQAINDFLAESEYKYVDYFKVFNEVDIAPTPESQATVDWIFSYLARLYTTHEQLASELKVLIREGVNQSEPSNMDPLKRAVVACKNRLTEENLNDFNFFTPLFDSDSVKQKAYNRIFNYFNLLESKGKALIAMSQQDEGKQLCTVVQQLREQTFNASNKSPKEQKEAFLECGLVCKQLLQNNQHLLDIRRNKHYIWAEAGVIFASLIVLYPLVAGINYLATGRVGFFSQTSSAMGAKKIEHDFTALNTVSVSA